MLKKNLLKIFVIFGVVVLGVVVIVSVVNVDMVYIVQLGDILFGIF